jgi:hypothetical protein
MSSTIHTSMENHSTNCCCGRMPEGWTEAAEDEIPKGPFPVLPLYRLSAE